jgi:NAD(P)-dependent dehydrogenase (short-subunit alcohol dehydrogenase family)
VNVVAPGWFDSPMIDVWMESPRLSQLIFDDTALGRWGTVDELVGAYLFLASDGASFITGAVLHVDGGYQLG